MIKKQKILNKIFRRTLGTSLQTRNQTRLGYVPAVALMLSMAFGAYAQKTLPAGTGTDSYVKVEVGNIALTDD